MKHSIKLLNEFEERGGAYIINIDTAEREFVLFHQPKSKSQLVVSSVCNHVKSAIKHELLTYGEFKSKYPKINAYLDQMKFLGYRTFT